MTELTRQTLPSGTCSLRTLSDLATAVIVVTGRRDTEENIAAVKVPGCSVIFTRLAGKEWFCKHERGIDFDVWIDDEPLYITENR